MRAERACRPTGLVPGLKSGPFHQKAFGPRHGTTRGTVFPVPTVGRGMRVKALPLIATAALVIAACGGDPSDTPSTTDSATTTEQSAEVTEVPHRVLVDGLDGGGRPWTTARVASDEELASLAPEASVDWETEVVFRFTLAESGSCPFDDMQGIVFDRSHLRMYPVVPLVGDPDVCTDDANPHTIVVAVAKTDLPEGQFFIFVNGDGPPSGVTEGVTRFAAGELTATNDDLPPLDFSGKLDVGETRIAHNVSSHCGLDRIFRPIDGRQWVLEENEIDYIPPAWEPVLEGEQIDLIIERVEADRLMVAPVGTDAELAYIPAPDETACL